MSTPVSHLGTPPSELDSALEPLARRAPRIAQADVFRAADELLVQGDRPTIDRVRMRLGRGSPNTINDHLDTWWSKLGARLRDLPGQEFPQLPRDVAQTLQQLWNQALTGAHEALQAALDVREQAVIQREQLVDTHARQLTEREQAATVRAKALDESLALAREQLIAANRRAEALEAARHDWDAEGTRLRTRIEALEALSADLRGRLDVATAAHQAERMKLQERYSAAETRWLTEVDRARQGAKETEGQLKAARSQLSTIAAERDHVRAQWLDAQAELKTAAAVRQQLEKQLGVRPEPKKRRSSVRPTQPRRK
jgi:hypothetical protein